MKDESAQRFKDLQEEFTLYEAARKDPKQASEQVAHVENPELVSYVAYLFLG